MYDWAHGQSDAIENVTHSICTLEFINHHALYDWFLEALELDPRPKQIEFAKLNFSHTVLSKRRLLQLVKEGHVKGWDDPRMPTLAGMRRRGYTPEAIVQLCERVGVAKSDSVVDLGLLEHTLREDLNTRCPRALGVIRPLELVIENFDEDRVEHVEAPFHPDDASHGTRKLALTKRLWVERDDFMESPPKQWYRLAPGKEVRLRYACYVTVKDVVRDGTGEITRLVCTWDPQSLGGSTADGRKVKGTIHWVSQHDAVDAEVRLYDRLYTVEDPMNVPEGKTFLDFLNPESLEVIAHAKLEPSLASPPEGKRVQLERLGYFIVDPDSTSERTVWNRTIQLRDSWAKIAQKL
jgi:glutaminyl-tRNA synthetase